MSLTSPSLTALGTALLCLAATGLPAPRSGLSAQERPVVMIDAGHGGEEVGVQFDGIEEKDLVLRIAFAIGAEFVEKGWDVRFTRTGDVAVAWDDRRAAAETAGAALLLMLHANGDDDLSLHGAEVYVDEDNAESSRAGGYVAEALRAAGSVVVEEPRPWPFLKSTTVPTVMIELAYMTHPVERRLLLSDAFHHELGEALASAGQRLRGM